MGSPIVPVERCGVSVKVTRWSPVSGDDRAGRRHRHLGMATGDERGKHHTEGSSVSIAHAAREHEPVRTADPLSSGCDARIGWLEAETVSGLYRVRYLPQPVGQVQEFRGADVGSEAISQAPPGLRGQRRGYEEAPSLEFEDRVHTQDMLACRLADHSIDTNDTVHTASHMER